MSRPKRPEIKHRKRSKEEMDALFFVIRWTKKHGWIKCREIIESIEQKSQVTDLATPP